MSSKWGLKIIFMSIIFIIIVNGYAKDVSGVERGQNRLNEYISHYETLNYDRDHINASHNRAKRSVTKDHQVYLKFSAHGKNFHLRLKRDLNIFSDSIEFYDRNGPIDVSTDHIYEGNVIGDHSSYVFGSIHNGIFEGKIITERDAYYIENAKHYFPTYHMQKQDQPIALRRTTDKYFSDTKISNHTTTRISVPTSTPSSSEKSNDDIADKNIDLGFHSIIYKESHVDDAYKEMRDGHVGSCGITEEVSQWMENIQNSAVEELPVPMSKDVLPIMPAKYHKLQSNQTPSIYIGGDEVETEPEIEEVSKASSKISKNDNKLNVFGGLFKKSSHVFSQQQSKQLLPKIPLSQNDGVNDDFKYPFQKYSKDANFRFESSSPSSLPSSNKLPNANREDSIGGIFYDPETGRRIGSPTDDDWHERVHDRVRRASGSSGTSSRREDNKNTCSLYIQTDPLIWRHIREGIADHDRGRKYEIDVKTREEITSLIAHHVTAVNYIYRNTKFDGRTEHRNIRFEVQRIKIDDDTACRSSYNGPHNAFCNEHMDVSNFLNLHSLEDHSDFCLAYVFTYRDFTGGTLGLAWVASASGASGGICEKYKTYTETVGGQYQSTKRSLNTGIITFVNYNSRVPPKVSQLTLAHEIGHNFGSPHDYPQECRPGGLNGNFIMFASATSGDRPNNSKFSPCSIRNISNVLDVLVGNQKRDCFKASEGAFCGNKIVESGEECDCGFNEEECKDICCYPRLISEYDQSLNSTAKGCTRRANTQCSPSQGPCCVASSCKFVPTNYHQKCKEETECSWSSTCNGTTSECPDPKPRDDKTKCNNGTALCIAGDCSGSICLLWNMSECFLTSQIVPNVDKRKLCELACQNGNETSTCRSTSEFAHMYGLPDGGISLRPGSPCDNFQGYCDVFLKCRAVDADGPLVRLKNLLLNRETLLTVAEWVIENWYIVVLMGIAFIIVMGIFIKCCAVHTPSSNPKKRRARRISETLRAPMNTLRRMRHPHNRGAGPRSIPPPVHEQRATPSSSYHRSHPVDWDRRNAGGHSIVPLPTGGGHASRSAAAVAVSGRSGGRNARPISSRGSGSRSGHGYADQLQTSTANNFVGASVGLGVGGSNNQNASSSGMSAVAGGGLVRGQMPLPTTPQVLPLQPQQQPQSHQSQQTQQQHQAYYAPKEPQRNKSRSSRSTSNSAVTKSKDLHKHHNTSSKKTRRNVY